MSIKVPSSVYASPPAVYAAHGRILAIFCSPLFFIRHVPLVVATSKMSPNTVFSRALDQVRNHHEVTSRFGTPIKGYGRDHGGKREGRRNFIEHTEYKSDEDGSKRTRVRFNLEGPHGKAFVFAEVSSEMSSGEFVYCKFSCFDVICVSLRSCIRRIDSDTVGFSDCSR